MKLRPLKSQKAAASVSFLLLLLATVKLYTMGIPADGAAINTMGENEQAESKKIAITFDDDVIIGLSQEISY